MLASLLKTETISPDLKRWVNSKAEGNPFYLEELVNALSKENLAELTVKIMQMKREESR